MEVTIDVEEFDRYINEAGDGILQEQGDRY